MPKPFYAIVAILCFVFVTSVSVVLPAFAAEPPQAIDDVDDNGINTVSMAEPTILAVIDNDFVPEGVVVKRIWLLDVNGARVDHVETDDASCRVDEDALIRLYCGAAEARSVAGGYVDFRYVLETAEGQFSNAATARLFMAGAERFPEHDDSVTITSSYPVSFPLGLDNLRHLWCLSSDEDGQRCFNGDSAQIRAEGEWLVDFEDNGIPQRLIFTPLTSFVGTSTIYIREYGDPYQIVKYSVTIDPDGQDSNLGTPPVAMPDALVNEESLDVTSNDKRGKRKATFERVAFVDAGGTQKSSITIDGVECTTDLTYLSCDFGSSDTDRVQARYVVIDEMGLVSQPADLIVVRNAEVLATTCFSDVTVGNTFAPAVQWACDTGLSTGWPIPGADRAEFRPDLLVQRDAAAAFLYRAAGSPAFNPPTTSPFTDVQTTDQHYKAITWAVEQGITTGWPDGTFRATESISRDAFVVFMARFVGAPTEAPTEDPFGDVRATDPFAPHIEWAKTAGITNGWPDGTFRPKNGLDRETTVVFIQRMCATTDRCTLNAG